MPSVSRLTRIARENDTRDMRVRRRVMEREKGCSSELKFDLNEEQEVDDKLQRLTRYEAYKDSGL
jgi:hypothetical protein